MCDDVGSVPPGRLAEELWKHLVGDSRRPLLAHDRKQSLAAFGRLGRIGLRPRVGEDHAPKVARRVAEQCERHVPPIERPPMTAFSMCRASSRSMTSAAQSSIVATGASGGPPFVPRRWGAITRQPASASASCGSHIRASRGNAWIRTSVRSGRADGRGSASRYRNFPMTGMLYILCYPRSGGSGLVAIFSGAGRSSGDSWPRFFGGAAPSRLGGTGVSRDPGGRSRLNGLSGCCRDCGPRSGDGFRVPDLPRKQDRRAWRQIHSSTVFESGEAEAACRSRCADPPPAAWGSRVADPHAAAWRSGPLTFTRRLGAPGPLTLCAAAWGSRAVDLHAVAWGSGAADPQPAAWRPAGAPVQGQWQALPWTIDPRGGPPCPEHCRAGCYLSFVCRTVRGDLRASRRASIRGRVFHASPPNYYPPIALVPACPTHARARTTSSRHPYFSAGADETWAAALPCRAHERRWACCR